MFCEQIAVFWCGSRPIGWGGYLLDNYWAKGGEVQSECRRRSVGESRLRFQERNRGKRSSCSQTQ